MNFEMVASAYSHSRRRGSAYGCILAYVLQMPNACFNDLRDSVLCTGNVRLLHSMGRMSLAGTIMEGLHITETRMRLARGSLSPGTLPPSRVFTSGLTIVAAG